MLDEEGYCRIIGRIKDTIIRGGENIFPREVEEFLFTNPKIEDVQVVGVSDQKYVFIPFPINPTLNLHFQSTQH